MPRDYRKLVVFAAADRLVTQTYAITGGFPSAERFGLQGQLRRAAISVASNIVEGSARRTTREYVRFLNVAAGSASEAAYLADLSGRLGFLEARVSVKMATSFGELVAQLHAMVKSLTREVREQPGS
jgi:four helix bundle protein